jgi:hypothetical protein
MIRRNRHLILLLSCFFGCVSGASRGPITVSRLLHELYVRGLVPVEAGLVNQIVRRDGRLGKVQMVTAWTDAEGKCFGWFVPEFKGVLPTNRYSEITVGCTFSDRAAATSVLESWLNVVGQLNGSALEGVEQEKTFYRKLNVTTRDGRRSLEIKLFAVRAMWRAVLIVGQGAIYVGDFRRNPHVPVTLTLPPETGPSEVRV